MTKKEKLEQLIAAADAAYDRLSQYDAGTIDADLAQQLLNALNNYSEL